MKDDTSTPPPSKGFVRARRWRRASRRIRAAVWRLQSPEHLLGVLDEVRDAIRSLEIPVDGCSVNLVDLSTDPPSVTVHSLTLGRTVTMQTDAAQRVLGFWRAPEPVLRDLDGDDPYGEKALFPHLGTIADVPFDYGTLAVNSRLRHAFREAHLARLQDMADMIGDGLRRLEELRRIEVRRRIREQVWHMREPEDIVPVMQTLREGLRSLGVSYLNCGINYIRVQTGPALVHTMRAGQRWERRDDERANPRLERMWRDGQVVYRRDLLHEDPYGERDALAASYGEVIRSVIDVPFSHGTLALNHRDPEAFSDEQVALLQDLAAQLEDGFRRMEDLQQLRDRNRALSAAVEEKEVLLQEVHHRVKNNLQVISSLLSLRAHDIDDDRARRSFEESRARIQAMAMVHERLYDTGHLSRLDAGGYVRDLAQTIMTGYGHAGVRLEVEVEPHAVGLDTAIHCGLVLHELLSNALEHAFPGGEGRIVVEARPTDSLRGWLSVRDDGIGLPEGLDLSRPASLGLQLVRDLVGQLGSALEVRRTGGTVFGFSYALASPTSSH